MVILIALLIAAFLAGWQIYYFQRTRTAATRLHDLFPVQQPVATVVRPTTLDAEGAGAPEAQDTACLQETGVASEGFRSILDGINAYLARSRGMPVTFLVMQDIVERTTESYEQAAAGTVTLPLYIGLMGTFLGVIVGLISLSAGQSASMEDTDLRRFLSGVLVAMFGSLIGLLLYVFGRRSLAKAQSAASFRKRDFFILLQSELLPAAGQEVSTALYSLQANLLQFNQDFRANLSTFGTAMEAPANTLQQQRELLQALETTDLKRIIEANASTMKALKTAAPVLQDFLGATRDFVSDLQAAHELSTKLTSLLDRVTTFESGVNALGSRFKQESFATDSIIQLITNHLDALEGRRKLVQQFVDVQDDTIRRSFQAQEVEVQKLLATAQQEIATAGQQLSGSIAAAVGGDKAGELLGNIALLRDIAQRTDSAQKSLIAIAGRKDNPRVEELLTQILTTLHAQANRTLLPQFINRMFPGDKGGLNTHAK